MFVSSRLMMYLDCLVQFWIPGLEPLTSQNPPDSVDDGHVKQGGRLHRLAVRLLQHLQEVAEFILDKFRH